MNLRNLFRSFPDSFDERVPPPEPAAGGKPFAWNLAAGSFVALLVTAGGLWAIVPRFMEVYARVGVELPALTLALLKLSRLVCHYPWLVGLVLLFVPWGLGRLSDREALLAHVLLPLLAIVTWGWMIVALFLPLIVTLEGIKRR